MSKKLDCLKLINFIENSPEFQNYIIHSKKILLAYSGGQDSTSLLAIFYILSQKWGFKLGVVYCNHGWTKKTDAILFALTIMQYYKLPFYYVDTDPRIIKKPENIARHWRYEAFHQILILGKYDFLVTGHTLSDKVETVLFNLCRGCGLKGVTSLKPMQKFKNCHKFHFKYQIMELTDFKKCFETFKQTKKYKHFHFCSNHNKFQNVKHNYEFINKYSGLNVQNLFAEYLLNSYFKKICGYWSPYFKLVNSFYSETFFQTQSNKPFSLITFFNPVSYLTAKTKFITFLLLNKNTLNFQSYKNSKLVCDEQTVKIGHEYCETLNFDSKTLNLCQTYDNFRLIHKQVQNSTQETNNTNKAQIRLKFKATLLNSINYSVSSFVSTDQILSNLKYDFLILQFYFKIKSINSKKFLRAPMKQTCLQFDNLDYLINFFNKKTKPNVCYNFKILANINCKNKMISKLKKGLKFNKKMTALLVKKCQYKKKYYPIFVTNSYEVDLRPGADIKYFKTSHVKITVTNFIIIRPLLKIDRETIFNFVQELKLPIYLDASNNDIQLTRNLIRHRILPLLKQINSKAEKNIYKFSQISNFYYENYGQLFCSLDDTDYFHP